MASKKSPSIFGTLQKTTEAASAVNGEFVRQLRVSDLEDNPMNRFSMAEDEQFLSTVESVKKDGFLEDHRHPRRDRGQIPHRQRPPPRRRRAKARQDDRAVQGAPL